jgi:4'-phosphopantetheinyl transferase
MLDPHEGQVDLWFTRTDRVDSGLAARYRALLTQHELAQQARFYFEKDRHRYLVTRALAREVLSRYAPVAPDEWRFEADSYGKPHIVAPAGLAQRIAFNISHTDGLVIVGVSRGRALGVDAECMQRRAALEVAERFFSPLEVRSLQRLARQAQAMRFWELWTLKESYIKARGMGLSIPLDRFAFQLDRARRVALEFAPGFDDVPSRWQFWQMRPTEHHLLALCVESPAEHEAPIRLSVRETTPLRSHCVVDCAIDRCSDLGEIPKHQPHVAEAA